MHDGAYIAVGQLNAVRMVYDSSMNLTDENLTQALESSKEKLIDIISKYERVKFS